MTHFIDHEVIKEYRKLRGDAGPRYDVVLLYNVTNVGTGRPIPDDVVFFRFTQADLRQPYYPNKPPVLSAANVELFPMLYARRHPWYAHYWAIEYDVRFSGSWSALLEAFACSRADLLGTSLRRYDKAARWPQWASLTIPGEGLPRSRWMCGFFPICRLSARAMERLDEAYRGGWGGHCGASVPTILSHAGLAIEDIGGDGPLVAPNNRNRFYENTPGSSTLSPGTLVSHPLRLAAGGRANLLWHPVRLPGLTGWGMGRGEKLIRQAKSWVQGNLAGWRK